MEPYPAMVGLQLLHAEFALAVQPQTPQYHKQCSGIGSSTSSLTDYEKTQPYVRAYATNSVGTQLMVQYYLLKNISFYLAAGQSYQGGIIATFFQPRFRVHFRRNSWFSHNYVKPKYRDSMGLFRNFN
jgi:hypothetical protein